MPNDELPPFRPEHFRPTEPEPDVTVATLKTRSGPASGFTLALADAGLAAPRPATPAEVLDFWETPPIAAPPPVRLAAGDFRLEIDGEPFLPLPPPPIVIGEGGWLPTLHAQAEARLRARTGKVPAVFDLSADGAAGDPAGITEPASDPSGPTWPIGNPPPWARLISKQHADGLRDCAPYEHRRVGAPTRAFVRRVRRVAERALAQALPELAKLARTLAGGARRYGLRGATDTWLRSVRGVLADWPGRLAEWRARGDQVRAIASGPREGFHPIVVGRRLTPDEHRRARFLLAQLERAVADLAAA